MGFDSGQLVQPAIDTALVLVGKFYPVIGIFVGGALLVIVWSVFRHRG